MSTIKQLQHIASIVNLRSDYISIRSNYNTRKIVLKKGVVKTKYFAIKRAIQMAAKLFTNDKEWYSCYIEVPFDDGLIQMEISLPDFCTYFNLEIGKVQDQKYMNKKFYLANNSNRDTVDKFGELFVVTRLSRYIPPKSLLESAIRAVRKKFK